MSTNSNNNNNGSTDAPARRMRDTMTGVRLSFRWLGVRRSLSVQQKDQAAQAFGAAGDYISAGKKLIDTKHPSFKALTNVRGRALAFWKGMTLPFPDEGVRFMRQDQIVTFTAKMQEFAYELRDATEAFEDEYAMLKDDARERLGDLYREADYPASMRGMFAIEWSFPSVEPPEYLRKLAPDIWREECTKASARFSEAVELAERGFMEELSTLVTHITERLSGTNEDGKPKIFRDSAVEGLRDFFDRFKSLNIGSNDELDSIVDEAKRVVGGVEAQDLRGSGALRRNFETQMKQVRENLDAMTIDRPRRRIVRGNKERQAS